MTPSLVLDRAPAAFTYRWTNLRLALFYTGVALVYLPIPGFEGSLGPALVAVAILLHLLFSSLEYVVGTLAFAFLATACFRLSGPFQTLRWVCLAAAIVVVTLRFVLRTRAGTRWSFGSFDYLMVVFVGVAFVTALTSAAMDLSLVKLGALACLFYVLSQSARGLVEQHGPAAARRLVLGLLIVTAPLIALPILGSVLAFGPYTFYAGWFSGYLGNPNAWANLLIVTLPWMCPPLLRRAGRWSAGNWWLAAGVLVVIFYLIRSGSRAGMLAAAVAGTLFCLIHGNRRIAAFAVIATVLFSARTLADPDFVPALIQRYVVKHGKVEILQSRKYPWRLAQKQFEERPWLGMGFGVSSGGQANWNMDVQTGASMNETGSSVWGTLSQVGVAGASLVFLAILGLLAQAGWFVWRVRDPWLTAVYASVAGLTVNCLFEGWLLAPGNYSATYYWLQCFFLSALISCYRPRSRGAAGFRRAA